MKQLLPCPFCGGAPEKKQQGNQYTKDIKITIACASCRAERTDGTMRHSLEWLEDIVAENWNRRVKAKNAPGAHIAEAESTA